MMTFLLVISKEIFRARFNRKMMAIKNLKKLSKVGVSTDP